MLQSQLLDKWSVDVGSNINSITRTSIVQVYSNCLMITVVTKDREAVIRPSPFNQTGKYVVRADDVPRGSKQPCAQRPIKRAEFEKLT